MGTIGLNQPLVLGVKYRTNGQLKWHERLRLKLAYKLVASIKAPDTIEMFTGQYKLGE